MSGNKNLTEGKVGKVLLRFSVPFFLANLLQALYGAVDLMVVGKFCSAQSVAAVSTGTQVTQIITSLITGFTLAGTVLVGRYTGMGKKKKVEETIGTTLAFFAVFSLALTLVFLLAVPVILGLLQVPEASYTEAFQYVTVCGLGIFFICEYNALSAVLRGYGDSLSPLLFVGAACVCNIAGDFLLVGCFSMGAAGTAAATVFSQGVSMLLAAASFWRRKKQFAFSARSLRLQPQILKEVIQVGLPVSFQECMVRLSFLYLTSITNRLGVSAASAVGIASKYDVFAMLPAASVGSALSALTAQNMGAGKKSRADQFLRYGTAVSFFCSLVFFCWAQMSPETMLGLFTNDSGILKAGIPFLKSCSLDYVAVSLLFPVNGYLNGREKTVFTMANNCMGALLIRVPILGFLRHEGIAWLGLYGLASPIATASMAGMNFVYLVWLKKREERRAQLGVGRIVPLSSDSGI